MPRPGYTALAVVATACYLPLRVRHVWHATRGSRPAGDRWTLLAMAVVIIGVLPVIGTSWLMSLHALAVSALIVLRPPWSLLVVAGLLAAPAPLAITFGDPQWAAFAAISVIWRGAAVFVLGVADRSHPAAPGGPAAAGRAGNRPRAAADRRGAAAHGGRRAGGDRCQGRVGDRAGRTQSGDGGGRAAHPGRTLPAGTGRGPPDDPRLPAAVAQLLHHGTARDCWIVVTRQDGRVQLELRTDGSAQAATQVAVG